MIVALAKEIAMRKQEFENDVVETIYFGGGTPSILQIEDLKLLIDEVYKNYNVVENPEITLEANPDDLTIDYTNKLSVRAQYRTIFEEYKNIGINRLSIGIQSFFEDDLQLMNRAHNAQEAKKCLENATQYFDNITIDLIYGIPNMTNQKWLQNIETALSFGIPHISSYALTVEPKTALHTFIEKGKIAQPDDAVAQQHFEILVNTLQKNGYTHYEISNFGKENYFSRANSGYWLGKKYIGIGPSAHSFDGKNRSWNISNNSLYIQAIHENRLPCETEILSKNDRYNEYVMTGLRTIWGVSLEKIKNDFGESYLNYLLQQAQKYIENKMLIVENQTLKTTTKGKFFCDGIASDLFLLNLE